MMMRLILTICLMIGLMMPSAWAGITEDLNTLQQQTAELLTSYQKQTEESALSQVTIESEDWVEGDTYYIRYTFTNPTNEMIVETVAHTFVEVDASSENSFSQSLLKEDTEKWQLSIKPHSSVSHTAMFPIEPSYIHFSHDQTVFRLTNGDSLWYTWHLLNTPPPAEIATHFEPTALDKGNLTITVTNRSSAPLTSMYHLNIYTTIKPTDTADSNKTVEIITSLPDSFSLDLSPAESKTVQTAVPLPTFPNTVYPPYQVMPSFEIDNILYKYSRSKNAFMPFQRCVYYNLPSNAPSMPAYFHIPITGHMETIDDAVVYYLTIQNNGKSTYHLKNIGMATEYLNKFNTRRALYLSLSFAENPIVLQPNETKYYSLTLPLLTDTPQQTLESTTVFGKEDSLQNAFDRNPKVSPIPLHPMQKAVYEPLLCSFIHITAENRSILSILKSVTPSSLYAALNSASHVPI